MTPESSKEFLQSYSHLHLHALGAATRETVNDLKNGEKITYSACPWNQHEINYMGLKKERYTINHVFCPVKEKGSRKNCYKATHFREDLCRVLPIPVLYAKSKTKESSYSVKS